MADRDSSQTHAEPPPGHRVKQYTILSEIGRGGMGVLYLALDTVLERKVALKRTRPELASDLVQQQRFLREGRAAARLTHPNIVTVFEAFEDQGVAWLSMQLVEGQSLRDRLAAGEKFTAVELARFGEELTSALEAAHRHKILHRDITPRNIMIDTEGRALLMDFGLARFTKSPEELAESTQPISLTGSGHVVGTPQYMAPEQILAQPVDVRSDIFSLGVALYEMCTGVRAFSGREVGDLLNAIMHREPEPISRFTYEVPEEFERIIRKCIAKRPDERYQNTADLLVDMRNLRRRLDFDEYSGSHETPVRSRRFPLWMPIVVGAALLLGAWGLWQLADRDPEVDFLPQGQPLQITKSSGMDRAPAIAPDGRRVAFASTQMGNLDIYVVGVGGGHPLPLTHALAADYDPAWLPDGSALLFVSERGGGPAIWKVGQFGGSATMLVANARDPAISPDGTRVAFSRPDDSGDLRIAVAELDDPVRARLLTDEHDGLWRHISPAWSPDGRLICYSTQENLWIVPVDGGQPYELTTDGSLDVDPVWAPDGKHVYFASYRQGTLALWRVGLDGAPPRRVTLGTGPESHPSLSSDGRRLVYTTEASRHDLVLFDRAGLEVRLPGFGSDWMPAIAPDAESVVFVSDRWGEQLDLWLQSLREGLPATAPRRLTDHPGDASHPVFSPDGQWIAYYRIVDQQRDIWTLSLSTGESIQFTDDPAQDLQPAWSSDGSRLAFSSSRSGTSAIWTATARDGRRVGEPALLSGEGLNAMAPSWSPDDKIVAFVGWQEEGWDVWLAPADGSAAPVRLTTGADVERVRWDPSDGTLLVSGSWKGDWVVLHRVSAENGEVLSTEPLFVFGQSATYPFFDVTPDGRRMVASQQIRRGDIWMLETRTQKY